MQVESTVRYQHKAPMLSYQPPPTQRRFPLQGTLGWGVLLAALALRATGDPGETWATVATPQNPILRVGILQHFGRSEQDQVELAAPTGSLLTLEFPQADGSTQRQRTPRVTLGIVNRALATPETVYRLVLSSHKSFESAEASANRWQALGIRTEIAQPQECKCGPAAPTPLSSWPRFSAMPRPRGSPRCGLRSSSGANSPS
jgi:hypothetical protein